MILHWGVWLGRLAATSLPASNLDRKIITLDVTKEGLIFNMKLEMWKIYSKYFSIFLSIQLKSWSWLKISEWLPSHMYWNSFLSCSFIDSVTYFFLQLIKPEELVSPNMDELSMMTYLSQYPNAKLKQGAPLRPRTNANRWVICRARKNMLLLMVKYITFHLFFSSK